MAQTEAQKAAQQRYRQKHREKERARSRAYYQKNRAKELARHAAWRKANPDTWREILRASDARPERRAAKAEAERTPERKAVRRAWREANSEKFAAILQEWERSHRAERRKRHHERQANDPEYKIRRALRANLYRAIKYNFKTGSSIQLLGCSIEELRSHLERLWQPEMSWNNFGRLDACGSSWQIDHKRPLSSFNLQDRKDLEIACHWTNLQPMWALDNRRKWNKI